MHVDIENPVRNQGARYSGLLFDLAKCRGNNVLAGVDVTAGVETPWAFVLSTLSVAVRRSASGTGTLRAV